MLYLFYSLFNFKLKLRIRMITVVRTASIISAPAQIELLISETHRTYKYGEPK
jgi:hypothetical protein